MKLVVHRGCNNKKPPACFANHFEFELPRVIPASDCCAKYIGLDCSTLQGRGAIRKIRDFQKWKFSLFRQRHSFSRSFGYFLPYLFSIFWNSYFIQLPTRRNEFCVSQLPLLRFRIQCQRVDQLQGLFSSTCTKGFTNLRMVKLRKGKCRTGLDLIKVKPLFTNARKKLTNSAPKQWGVWPAGTVIPFLSNKTNSFLTSCRWNLQNFELSPEPQWARASCCAYHWVLVCSKIWHSKNILTFILNFLS